MKGIQVLLLMGWCMYAQAGPRPHVNTSLGELEGKLSNFSSPFSKQSRRIVAYLGVPYAKPPIGERRFRPPEPVEPWEGTLKVTINPPACPQLAEPGVEISEDCLYLNVFVAGYQTKNAAVMVFIHGGSLTTGSGHELPGIPLAAIGDVIVVTLNYRLNIFGFFTTEDGEIPGNLGMMDQRLALKWVYENIEAFGGDPERITLFGESSGARSVGYHVGFEESRKYFKRAIIQSGAPIAPWARILTSDDVNKTNALVASIGGCDGQNLAECLKGKSTEELLTIHGTVDAYLGLESIWHPAVDDDFFPTDNISVLFDVDYSDYDIIIGTNKDEGTFETLFRVGYSYTRPNVTREQFSDIITDGVDPLRTGIVEAVYADYLESDGNYEPALSAVLGDTQFTCGSNQFADYVASRGARVFLYRMTMEPVQSVWQGDWFGASHADELQFVFGLPFLNPPDLTRSRGVTREVKFSYYFMKIWSEFAKSGNPNVFPQSISEWPEYSPDTKYYKELDLDFSNKQYLRQHQCNFWDNLYPEIVGLQQGLPGSGTDGN